METTIPETVVETKTFIRYFDENFQSLGDVEIDHRDPYRATPPNSCVGFKFYDQTTVTHDGETFVGNIKNYSPSYVTKGLIKSAAEIKATYPKYRVTVDGYEKKGQDQFIIVKEITRILPVTEKIEVLSEGIRQEVKFK